MESKPLFPLFVRRLIAGMMFFGIFGVLLAVVNVFWQKSLESPISNGYKGIFFTTIIVIAVTIWQVRDLKRLFNGQGSKTKIIMLKAIIYGTLTIALANFACIFLEFYGPVAFREWFSKMSFNFNPLVGGGWLAVTLEALYYSGIFMGLVATLLIHIFLCGKFNTGIAASIAFHNFLNGGGFDFAAFYKLFLKLDLSNLGSFFITLAWFVVSMLLSNEGGRNMGSIPPLE